MLSKIMLDLFLSLVRGMASSAMAIRPEAKCLSIQPRFTDKSFACVRPAEQ